MQSRGADGPRAPRAYGWGLYKQVENNVTHTLESAWFQPLNLKCDLLVSKFAAFQMGQLVPLCHVRGQHSRLESHRDVDEVRKPRLVRDGARMDGGGRYTINHTSLFFSTIGNEIYLHNLSNLRISEYI
jgi:hypothetical protein